LLAIYSELEVLLYSYYAVLAVLIPVTIASEPATLRAVGVRPTDVARPRHFGRVSVLSLDGNFPQRADPLGRHPSGLIQLLIPFFGVLLAA
jgi:hypothetical protein